MALSSAERVHAALRLQQPDRVPVLEFVIDPKVARAAVSGCRDAADCMDRLGMDGVGCGACFEAVRENSDGSFVDEWGVVYRRNAEAVHHPIAGPIKTLKDARAYVPPDPGASHRLGQLPELVQRYRGRRAICFHHRAAFMWSAYLMNIEEILMGFLTAPELVELVMDKVLECNMQVVRRAIQAGAEVIVLGDDYAANLGPLMSPAVFEHFILPRLRKMIDMIHEEGAFCIKHTDGNIYSLLEMIVSAGPDGLNPIEPVAGMDMATVKRLVGDKVCLAGNIDCAHLLPNGTPAEVGQAVRQAIRDAGHGGGLIITSSNSIHSSCHPRNLVAMIDAVRQYGCYPLEGETVG